MPWLLGLLVVAGIVVGMLPKATEVELGEVVQGPLVVSVVEEGKTRIRHRHVISPPFAGSLKRIELRSGDPIEAGKTVLAEVRGEWAGFLNPRLLAETEVRVKAAEASKARSGSALERAQTALDLAIKERTRSSTLKESGAISSREWDAAENQVELLKREVRTAEFSRDVAAFEWAQAQAALQQAKGPETQGEDRVYRIVAPISGVVLQVMEENERFVTAGFPVMEVGDLKDLEAEIELLSSDAVTVRPGAEVSIEEWGGGHPLKGRVSVVEPGAFMKISALGVEEQRVKVRVDFAESIPEGSFLGDRYRVEARIQVWSAASVVLVPTGALFRRGGDWFLFLETGNAARLARVEIGHSNGRFAEVSSGVKTGDRVVLHPPDTLESGKTIRRRRLD